MELLGVPSPLPCRSGTLECLWVSGGEADHSGDHPAQGEGELEKVEGGPEAVRVLEVVAHQRDVHEVGVGAAHHIMREEHGEQATWHASDGDVDQCRVLAAWVTLH